MRQWNDAELLSAYADRQSEEAFGVLVERYIALVYSAALRQVRNPPLAEEVTQAAFVILAQKARRLDGRTVLSGWLCRTAHYVARNALKSELRRQSREKEAHMQSLANEPEADVWRPLAPLLDEAVAQLNDADRNAVVLRFYERKPLNEVGDILGVGPDVAQKRVSRALEKLRKFFARRGVDSTATAIGETISANSVQAAPVALAKTVTAVALAKGATASISTLTLIKGALKIMAWTNAKTAIVAVAVVLFAAGTATVTIEKISGENSSVREQVLEIVRTNADNPDRGADLIARVGPSALPTLEQLIRWKKWNWDFFDTTPQGKMRDSAVKIVTKLGPAGVRPLTGALCEAVNNPEITDPNTIIPTCNALLHWSVPDSPQAVATLTHWLANTDRGSVIGDWDDDLGELPDATSLLIPWLKNPTLAYEIAHDLGAMGTNAAGAIPTLIEVGRSGMDTSPPPLKLTGFRMVYPQGTKKPVLRTTTFRPLMTDEQRERNRGSALEALGQIGVASPEVMAILQQALGDTNDLVRFGALQAIYALHQQPEEALPDVLNRFSPDRGTAFKDIVDWVGHLGEAGRDALPWLQHLTAYDYVQSLPEGLHANTGWDLAISTEDLREAANLAICEINPSQLDPTGVNSVEWLHQFSQNWEAAKRVRSETNALPVLAVLTPLLDSTNKGDAAMASYIVLGIAPGNPAALQTLRRCAREGNLTDRLLASDWLWDETGDATNLLQSAIEGLKSSDSITGQISANYLSEMGPDALSAVPALKQALWSQDTFVRSSAGKALRTIAPGELPPIH